MPEAKDLVIWLVLINNILNGLTYSFAGSLGNGLRAAGDVKFTMIESIVLTVAARLFFSALFGMCLGRSDQRGDRHEHWPRFPQDHFHPEANIAKVDAVPDALTWRRERDLNPRYFSVHLISSVIASRYLAVFYEKTREPENHRHRRIDRAF